MQMPAIALAAAPGRRKWTVEAAQEIERRGFQGAYCASFGDAIGLCVSMAHCTTTLRFGTSITPIYLKHPFDLAQQAAYIHELSGGRFTLGLGVSHGPMNDRLGVATGRPLSDTRKYVAQLRAAEKQVGELPPIMLASLRTKMTELASEISQGAVWANASRSHMASSLSHIPESQLEGEFFIGDMIPTCIDDDREAAANVMKRVLSGYVILPNYRNYWKEAGYGEEMAAIETALAAGDRERVNSLMSDRWLSDSTLYGSKSEVLGGLEAWFATGLKTPILVPSSTKGGQVKAFEELFAAFE